jgi:hypothetical protein
MKRILTIASLMMLTGCSTLAEYWPTPHDPALAQGWTRVQQQMLQVKCDDREDFSQWIPLRETAQNLRIYAEFRSDNQVKTVQGLEESINKAYDTKNLTVCNHNLKLAQTRLNILKKVWGTR